jgi:hypothetical protein
MKTDGETDDGMFMNLPNELIGHIYSFFDIGSLGKMAQVNSGRLSTYALSDTVWGSLVYRRFCVNPKQSRARAHGGTSWKDAFRTMSFCNRVPKCRYTSARKAIFAKGGGGKHSDPVSSWVLLSHTANCQTRRSICQNESTRFIELHVCLQNAKSGAGSVTIDLSRTTLHLMGIVGGQQLYGQPRILYRSTQDVPTVEAHSLADGVLELTPFEFCIIAMTFPCGVDVFETDVLARALSLRAPLLSSSDIIKATFIPECDVWKYYMELPGGFLSLNDKTSLVNG